MAQVYIVHGYTADGNQHWFPWLDKELGKIGVKCHRLNMPDSANPTPEAWLSHLEQQIALNEPTILVGHSLGCIAILNFLAKSQAEILGAVLVAGFYQPLPNLPQLTPFADFYQHLPACKPLRSTVIAALDDNVVAHAFSDVLAQHLNANYLRLPQGQHFCASQGVTALPEVLDVVKKWLV